MQFELNEIVFWWKTGERYRGNVEGIITIPYQSYSAALQITSRILNKDLAKLSEKELLKILLREGNIIRDGLFNRSVEFVINATRIDPNPKWYIKTIDSIKYAGDQVILEVSAERIAGTL